MAIKATEISDLIRQRIENFKPVTEARNVGTIVSVTDGICRIHGLADARYGEMLEFPGNTFGLALNLEQDSVGAVVLGEYKHLSEGDSVKTTGRILEVPVGPPMIRARFSVARGCATLGYRAKCRDNVPVPAVLGQVVESVIRVEQQVLAPLVANVVDENLPNLKPHDLVVGVALRSGRRRHPEKLAPCSQRDQRLVANDFPVLLQDRDAGILGIKNRSAALADDVDGVAERADRGGGSTARTID